MTQKAYLFRIELEGSRPLIWRRFFVPSYVSFGMFHEAVQLVMGWENEHMYEFIVDDEEYIPIPDEDGFNIANVPLGQLVNRQGQTVLYRYDFGDDWKHVLTLEDADFSPPAAFEGPFGCLEGAGCCPPEDVGGLDGFEDFLAIVRDPKNAEHEETNEWYMSAFGKDKPYDSERFDAAAITEGLVEQFM